MYLCVSLKIPQCIIWRYLSNLKAQIDDVGREVKISEDGGKVAIHGSILATNKSGYTASFLFDIVENVNHKRNPMKTTLSVNPVHSI